MRPDESDGFPVKLLGQRIRRLRAERQLTLADLSEETGLSRGFLSQVENGQTKTSLSALYRIAKGLKTTAPKLLSEGAEPLVSVVRGGDGPWFAADSAMPLQRARSLTSTPRTRIEVREAIIPVGFQTEPAWSHPGEEFLYVLSGDFSVQIEGHGTEKLRRGDSITYPASLPHVWIGGEEEARVINVVALPTNG